MGTQPGVMPGAIPTSNPMVVASMAAPMPAVSMAPPMAAPMAAPMPVIDWAIPQPTRAKYSALFAQNDTARAGFLAGVQARNILMQSGLPGNILAQVW